RLKQHQAEGVGAAREHEDVGAREDAGEVLTDLGAEEDGGGIGALELVERGAAADDELGAGEIEPEEGLEVLFHGDATDVEEHGPGMAQVRALVGVEERGVDALGPKLDVGEATLFEQPLEVG